MIRSLCLPEKGGWTNSSWKKQGEYKKRRLQSSPINGVKHDPPPSSFRATNVFVCCHGDGLCVCGRWCHCGVGSQKRNQRLTGESGNETCCVHTLGHTLGHTQHTHTETAGVDSRRKKNIDIFKNKFFFYVANDGGKTLPRLFPEVLLFTETISRDLMKSIMKSRVNK